MSGYADRMGGQRGRASTVTDLGDGTVLRTGGDPEREAGLMGIAAAHGIRVPRVVAVRPDALLLERIEGPTMADRLRRRPWQAAAQVAALASLHERLHRVPLDGATLLHLDLHPENVLLGPDGPVLIDWTNARSGRAVTDVAKRMRLAPAQMTAPLAATVGQTGAAHAGLMLANVLAAAKPGDQIGTPVGKRHFLALETGIRQKPPQVLSARRLLTGWIDRIEADQLGSQIHGTDGHMSVPS